MNDNIRQMDPLRSENWAGIYADVPEEVNAAVRLAYLRIRRHEQRKKRMIRTLSFAACAVLAVGVCAAGLNGRKTADTPDRVASPVQEITVLQQTDTVYTSNDDPCFHVYASCSHAREKTVELQLVTALEFEKTLCETCGANVEIQS